MGKQTFTNEFKQGVVQYVIDHPDESKLAIAKRFGIADSTVRKWIKDANKEILWRRKVTLAKKNRHDGFTHIRRNTYFIDNYF